MPVGLLLVVGRMPYTSRNWLPRLRHIVMHSSLTKLVVRGLDDGIHVMHGVSMHELVTSRLLGLPVMLCTHRVKGRLVCVLCLHPLAVLVDMLEDWIVRCGRLTNSVTNRRLCEFFRRLPIIDGRFLGSVNSLLSVQKKVAIGTQSIPFGFPFREWDAERLPHRAEHLVVRRINTKSVVAVLALVGEWSYHVSLPMLLNWSTPPIGIELPTESHVVFLLS